MIFILPVSLAIVYIIGSYYCKVLKDQERRSLASLVVPGRRKNAFLNKTDPFYFLFLMKFCSHTSSEQLLLFVL